MRLPGLKAALCSIDLEITWPKGIPALPCQMEPERQRTTSHSWKSHHSSSISALMVSIFEKETHIKMNLINIHQCIREVFLPHINNSWGRFKACDEARGNSTLWEGKAVGKNPLQYYITPIAYLLSPPPGKTYQWFPSLAYRSVTDAATLLALTARGHDWSAAPTHFVPRLS